MIILHDYMEQTDGGSRLCLELAQGLGCGLICGFVRRGHPFLAGFPGLPLRTILPAIPVPLIRQYLLARAFETRGARLAAAQGQAVFSGSYAPLAVGHRAGGGGNVLYCHTPPRFLYDDREAFLGLAPGPLRPLLEAFLAWFRPRYESAVARMDVIVANSETVRERIRVHLRREAEVVPPPCSVERYAWRPSEGYYLSLVRLDRLKRVDLLVRAFRDLPGQRLVVTSTGPEEAALKRLARGAPNIRFTGPLAEKDLVDMLAGCTATLCVARNEDFGMCAVESMAAGKPVIAAGAGGLAETVDPGRTGLLLAPDPAPEEIRDAVRAMEANRAKAMREDCLARASRYDTRTFIEKMRAVLGRA